MLEAFFSEISDEQFYQRTDFSEQVGDLLFANDDKTLLHIAGPKQLSSGQGSLPVYIVAKEHSELNSTFSLDSHGYIALTSHETGELSVHRISTSTKEPKFSDAQAAADLLDEAGPDYVPQATTTYHYRYRDLDLGDISLHDGDWYVLAGNGAYLSNQFTVHVNLEEKPEPGSDQPLTEQITSADFVEFYALDQATPVPDGRLQFGESNKDNFSHVLNYSLPDDNNPARESIPVHFLFSANEFETPLVVTLQVPKAASHLAADVRLGVIQLNLSALMTTRLPPESTLPTAVSLVVISRGVYLLSGRLAL